MQWKVCARWTVFAKWTVLALLLGAGGCGSSEDCRPSVTHTGTKVTSSRLLSEFEIGHNGPPSELVWVRFEYRVVYEDPAGAAQRLEIAARELVRGTPERFVRRWLLPRDFGRLLAVEVGSGRCEAAPRRIETGEDLSDRGV